MSLLRAGVTVGALIYGALAIGNGLDRLAPTHPGMAGVVPAPLATNALAAQTVAELDRNPRAAAGLAERLVARAPIEPISTALLGASRAAIGDDAGADRAFRVAGQLGWRVPLTQSYWLAAALAAGDTTVAAQRLDALLRQRPDLLQSPAIEAPFASGAARQSLVDRLAARPPWLEIYAGDTDPVPSAAVLAARVPALLLLAERGVVLGCTVVAPAMRRLAAAGLATEAQALGARHCPRG